MSVTPIASARAKSRSRPASVAPLAWRVIRDGPRPGAENMAIDHLLARDLGPDQGVLRLYGWSRPTVSFGRNEEAAGRYSREAAGEMGVDLVRRPTGGRSVYHHHELTYAVAVPAAALGGPRRAYRQINEALVAALRAMGAEVAMAPDRGIVPLDGGACFREAAGGEVVAGGRKLVGSAQARVDGALLQHGSILLSGSQEALGWLRSVKTEPRPGPITLQDLVGPVRLDDLEEALVAAWAGAFGGSWSEKDLAGAELADAHTLERDRYGTDSWTWRR